MNIRSSVLIASKPKRQKTTCTYLLALMISIAGCGTDTERTSDADRMNDENESTLAIDHSSPNTLAESYKTAFAEGDWPTVIGCITKESRGQFVSKVTMVTDMAVIRDQQKRAALDALLRKHGVEENRHPEVFDQVNDKGALLADLIDFGQKNPPPADSGMKGFGSLMDLWSKAEFANFQIDGNTATADVIAPDQPVGLFDFRRIDGKWYNDPAATDVRRKNRERTKTDTGS